MTDVKIPNIKDKNQLKLIEDVCSKILKNVHQGNYSFTFDYQYTNPQKDWYRPGPPKLTLSKEAHEWFKSKGFTTTDIEDCWGRSTRCDFGCRGDGICRVNISWPVICLNDNNFNFEEDIIFNSKYCSFLSFICKKSNEM